MKFAYRLIRPLLLFSLPLSTHVYAGEGNVSGKIVSLMGSASDPGIRIEGLISPNLCDGGAYNWLLFEGTNQEKQWLYSTALAMAVSGKVVAVYTNTDGNQCRIHNIQIINGLN